MSKASTSTNLHDAGDAGWIEGYRAIQSGVGLIDLSNSGKLEISGKNSTQFLNGLVSNEVKTLARGQGTLAAFLNVQGKVVALARIYQTGEKYLLELSPENREKIFNNLSRFVPAGEFFVRDLSDDLALLSLQGPRAGELLAHLAGEGFDLSPYDYRECTIAGVAVAVAAHSRSGQPGFDLFVPANEAPKIEQAMDASGAGFAFSRAEARSLDVARIEAGIAREPEEVNENYNLLETGREDAVSYTKGCYLGQEIIARIHWRGQPAKRVRGLWIEAEKVPEPGTLLYSTDGKKVGELTSVAPSPRFNRIIALAYVHRYYLEPGTKLLLRADEEIAGEAEVAGLPFTTS